MRYYLYHIFYYILYRKYRILVSNIWIEEDRFLYSNGTKRSETDWIYYNSSNGKYLIHWYHRMNYFTIRTGGNEIKFTINDGIDGHVCAFFVQNHKDKLINSEDRLVYQRNSKLKDLGI